MVQFTTSCIASSTPALQLGAVECVVCFGEVLVIMEVCTTVGSEGHLWEFPMVFPPYFDF